MNDSRGSAVHEATTVVHTGQSHCIETPVSPVVLAAAEESPFSGPITTGPLLPGLSLTQGFDSESFVVSAHTAAPVTAARTGTEQVAEKPANTAVSNTAVSNTAVSNTAVSNTAVSTAAVSNTAVSNTAAARGDAPAAFASDFTGAPSSWCIEPNLAARGPAYSVMRECLARQEAATPRGRLGRVTK